MNVDMLPNESTSVNMFLMTPSRTTPDATPTVVGCCTPVGEDTLSEPEAVELAALLKALADPVRLQLMSLIMSAGTAVCACDLPAAVNRSQPTVSHHLGILAKAGLLERTQVGKWAWFEANPHRLHSLSLALLPANCC
ncbi:MAG: metalloregulator ArsR/SmtB family transcription factor [Acidimicrobiales bacterium]